MTKDQLIRDQSRTICQLQRRIDKLLKEKAKLQKLLKRDFEVQIVTYHEISAKLKVLERPVLLTIIDLAKRYERPVSYPEIVKAFKRIHQFSTEDTTIMRTVRKLKEKGLLVKEGTNSFYPNLKNAQFTGKCQK